MKLVQLNVWQGRLEWHITHFLAHENPDIVCMQEVLSAPDPVPGWDNFSILEVIQKAMPDLKHWFFAPLFSYTVRGRKVVGGNLIGSRFPILDQQVIFTNGSYAEEETATNTRNFQSCKLDLGNGKHLFLVNHHAFWDKNPDGAPQATAMMQQVCDAALALGQPLIVSGDMNVVPESKAMQVFAGKLENLTATHGIKTTLSQLGHAFGADNIVPCDHVLIDSGIAVRDFYASDALVSDHKALILDFDVR